MSGQARLGKLLAEQIQELARGASPEPALERAFAKVNIRLKVVGRRADGYHLLSMINCTADLADDVSLEYLPTADIGLQIEPAGLLNEPIESNLAVRAYRAFWRAFDLAEPPVGCSITLHKRIPIGAGLGGGSSDAGAVLRILARTFKTFLQIELGLSDESFSHAMTQAALSCGADVPYAYTGGLCLVSGVGEMVTPLPQIDPWRGSLGIIVPAAPVPTAAFYEFYRANHPSVPQAEDLAVRALPSRSRIDLPRLIDNDFEGDVARMVPDVGRALAMAREAFPKAAGLTGCGSALFVLATPSEQDLLRGLEHEVVRAGMTFHHCSMTSPTPVA